MQTRTYIADRELQRLFHGSFTGEFRRSVRAFTKRRRMSLSTLGRLALNDPNYAKRHLGKGLGVQLATADEIRRYMDMPQFRPFLMSELWAFLDLTGLKPWQVGEWALREARFIRRLFGGASPYLSTIDRLRRWMHRQLRPEQLDAVLLAVARMPARGVGGGSLADFFIRTAIRIDRRTMDERSNQTVDDAPGRRAAGLEPAHAGAVPGHGRGAAVQEDRPVGAVRAVGSRRVARRVHARVHLRRGAEGTRETRETEMTTRRIHRFVDTAARVAMAVAPAVLPVLGGIDAAWATTDTTFAAPLTTVTDMVAGTGGQLAAVLAVGAALVGSVLRFNATQIMGAVGVGVAAGAGAGVVTSIVGTAII